MPDHRTKRQKLEAMANQTVSPHEARIARELLEKLPPEQDGGHLVPPSWRGPYDQPYVRYQEWSRVGDEFWRMWRDVFGEDLRDEPRGQRTSPKNADDARKDRPGYYFAMFPMGRCPHCGHDSLSHPATPPASWHYECSFLGCGCSLRWEPGVER